MEEDISALTGMVGGNDNKNVPSNRETYVSVLQKCPQIEEYLVGNAPPLFPLFQVTNSGFALLRSELFASLAASSPVDDQYGRVKQMDEWIHEILVALHAAGKRFELVPDQVMQHEVAGLPFESLRLGQFMRSLPDVLYSYAPGTDQWLLSRLVIDASLEDLRSRIHTKYLKQVADRIGTELVQLHQFAPWEQQVQQLVKVAHGLGQIDLAVELSASMVVPNVATPRALTEYVISAAAAMVGAVNLALLFDRGEFTALNIRNQQPTGDWRAFDLPTNPAGEGVASLLFQSVNLSDATHFSCLIDVLDQTAGPVQFSIDVASLDKTSHWSANKIVRDGKSIQWELEVPTELRGLCIVRLGVEVAHWKVPAASIMTRWTDPLFLQRN